MKLKDKVKARIELYHFSDRIEITEEKRKVFLRPISEYRNSHSVSITRDMNDYDIDVAILATWFGWRYITNIYYSMIKK